VAGCLSTQGAATLQAARWTCRRCHSTPQVVEVGSHEGLVARRGQRGDHHNIEAAAYR